MPTYTNSDGDRYNVAANKITRTANKGDIGIASRPPVLRSKKDNGELQVRSPLKAGGELQERDPYAVAASRIAQALTPPAPESAPLVGYSQGGSWGAGAGVTPVSPFSTGGQPVPNGLGGYLSAGSNGSYRNYTPHGPAPIFMPGYKQDGELQDRNPFATPYKPGGELQDHSPFATSYGYGGGYGAGGYGGGGGGGYNNGGYDGNYYPRWLMNLNSWNIG